MYPTVDDAPVLVYLTGIQLLGLNKSDGKVVFNHATVLGSGLLVTRTHIFVVDQRKLRLRAYAYPTGEPLYDVKVPGSYFSEPTVTLDGGNLIVAIGGEVTCFWPENGEVRWHQALKGKGTLKGVFAGPGWKALPAERR